MDKHILMLLQASCYMNVVLFPGLAHLEPTEGLLPRSLHLLESVDLIFLTGSTVLTGTAAGGQRWKVVGNGIPWHPALCAHMWDKTVGIW